MCSPCTYFDYGATFYDAKRLTKEDLPEADLYIIGGGAITTKIAALATRTDKPLVAWGIGQSLRPNTAIATTTPIKDYELIGSRDVGVAGTEWVPCASCMSPLFDEEYETKHERVSYYNSVKHTHPDMPAAINRHSFEEAIKFIGSSKIVHTNSYHGAYWATLLGKEVILEGAYSSKFNQFKHQPTSNKTYPHALEECREANIRFNDKVKEKAQ